MVLYLLNVKNHKANLLVYKQRFFINKRSSGTVFIWSVLTRLKKNSSHPLRQVKPFHLENLYQLDLFIKLNSLTLVVLVESFILGLNIVSHY